MKTRLAQVITPGNRFEVLQKATWAQRWLPSLCALGFTVLGLLGYAICMYGLMAALGVLPLVHL